MTELEYELMSIDGVRAVNYVCITQTDDYLGGINAFTPSLYIFEDISSPLPKYSYS